MKTLRAPAFITLLAATASFAAIAHAKVVRHESETIDLEGIDTVEIHISAGNVNLVGSDRSDLQFDLEKVFKTSSESEADEMDEKISRTVDRRGSKLVIEIEYKPTDSFWKGLFSKGDGVNFSADLQMPAGISAVAHTNGGNIDVSELARKLDAHTNGGNVTVARCAGSIEAHTNGGNIRVEELQGPANLHTNGGNIEVTASSAALEAHTNGGNIRADFRESISGPSKLHTNGGSIYVGLPAEFGFKLDAESRGGSVHFKHDGQLKGEIKNNKIDAQINGGGPALTLDTRGGSIEVRNI